MKITVAQIKAIMPHAESNIKANKHFTGCELTSVVDLMNKYAEKYYINTPLRWAHYLAQIAHESAELRYSEEIASGKAYDTGKLAARLGNTPQADGDGQKYKGRGLIQLTGRSNYLSCKDDWKIDVLANPEILAKPDGAVRSSMWFWWRNGLNILADRGEFDKITRRINGGTNGYAQRKKYLNNAYKVLIDK